MLFNHISEVKLFLSDLQNLIKPNKIYCIGETAICMLDKKIPQYFLILSDIEISFIYKNFDDVQNIQIYPFSFSFKYHDELFFILQFNKKLSMNNYDEIIDFVSSISDFSLQIPLIYDVTTGTIKNIKMNFDIFINKENKKDMNKNSGIRYFEYAKSRLDNIKNIKSDRDAKNNYVTENLESMKGKGYIDDSFLNKLILIIFKRIESMKNSFIFKISILFFALTSYESKILIKELSKLDFFNEFFPVLENCKYHLQSKEYHPEGSLYDHLILTAIEVEYNDFSLKISAILHDIGKIETMNYRTKEDQPKYPNHAIISSNLAKKYLRKISEYFRFYPDLIMKVSFLIENHMKIAFIQNLDEIKRKEILNSPYLSELLKLLKADLKASSADLNIYRQVVSYIQKKGVQNIIR